MAEAAGDSAGGDDDERGGGGVGRGLVEDVDEDGDARRASAVLMRLRNSRDVLAQGAMPRG